MFGRDFVVGGEDVADGGDAAESVPSRASSTLRMFISIFLSTRLLIEILPESICVGLILLVFLFHGRRACPTAPSTIFSLRK